MKIEIGESLFYSWLRHVKECQIVQTNWGVSSEWQLDKEEALELFMNNTSSFFLDKYGYDVYGNNSFSQLLKQAELDVIGISLESNCSKVFAVDVAFHENGLTYGSRQETVTRVIKKSLRTAICLSGYLGIDDGEIIFAAPKINNAVLLDLEPCVVDMNQLLLDGGYNFTVRIIANEQFASLVLKPILIASSKNADTSELFLRSYKLLGMFLDLDETDNELIKTKRRKIRATRPVISTSSAEEGTLAELKIGKLANKVLRSVLESEATTEGEIKDLQTAVYSKRQFDIQYPLLVAAESEFDPARYYKEPLIIRGDKYFMCSQWYETDANNDRPYLLNWLKRHQEDLEE